MKWSESCLVMSNSLQPHALYIQSVGFSRPAYWMVAFPFSGGSSQPRDRGIKPRSPALQLDSLLAEPPGKLLYLLGMSVRPTLSFPCCVMCTNIRYLLFSFWLTSLCVIGSGFIHLTRTDSKAFLFMAEQHFIVYMHHDFFIHLSVDGQTSKLLPCPN